MLESEREITLRFLAEPTDVNIGGKLRGCLNLVTLRRRRCCRVELWQKGQGSMVEESVA
jgi:hypothetical protein